MFVRGLAGWGGVGWGAHPTPHSYHLKAGPFPYFEFQKYHGPCSRNWRGEPRVRFSPGALLSSSVNTDRETIRNSKLGNGDDNSELRKKQYSTNKKQYNNLYISKKKQETTYEQTRKHDKSGTPVKLLETYKARGKKQETHIKPRDT